MPENNATLKKKTKNLERKSTLCPRDLLAERTYYWTYLLSGPQSTINRSGFKICFLKSCTWRVLNLPSRCEESVRSFILKQYVVLLCTTYLPILRLRLCVMFLPAYLTFIHVTLDFLMLVTYMFINKDWEFKLNRCPCSALNCGIARSLTCGKNLSKIKFIKFCPLSAASSPSCFKILFCF